MKKIFISILFLSLMGCSIFSPYGTSNIPDPAPLQKYSPQVAPKILWVKDVGTASEGAYLRLAPAVTDQAIYTIDQHGYFYATSKEGETLIKKNFKVGGKSNVASDGSIVAFVNEQGILQIVDVKRGELLWQATLPDQALAAPTILSNFILVKTIDGSVTAFDRTTSQPRWEYQHAVPALMLRASSAILVKGKIAYVGFADGKVVALNLVTGDEIWTQQAAEPQGFDEIERVVDIDANLILKNGRLFVATYQGQITALNANDGNILWQKPNSVYADITADQHALYAVNADGTITAYDQLTGKILWEQKDLAWRFLTGPLLYQNKLVVGDFQGYLHFIKPESGQLLGRLQIDKKPTSIINTPQILDQSLIVIDTQGHLVAVSA